MFWSFAIINKKLAETYFDKKAGKTTILGHCYVKPEEYETKHEQRLIKEDTAKFNFIYRRKNYRRIEL